jgi:penicillin-binding protein activator
MNANRIAALVMAVGIALAGCASSGGQNWRVDRVDPETRTDIDYRFNDEDARIVFQSMVADALSRSWIDQWMRDNGGQRPIIFLGNVRNETQDYINTGLFTTQVQEELINSGRVRVKAERDARAELRDERLDTRYNDPATIKAVAKELNADFALIGRIMDNKQRSGDGRTVVNYYQANMELVNVETAEKVWIQTAEIKKVARR